MRVPASSFPTSRSRCSGRRTFVCSATNAHLLSAVNPEEHGAMFGGAAPLAHSSGLRRGTAARLSAWSLWTAPIAAPAPV